MQASRTEITTAVSFASFVEGLYLEYLRRHVAWGGPARIPRELIAWTPSVAAAITPAAACAFRARVEDAACAIALGDKHGGVTYATEVRRLHDALAAALSRAGDPSGSTTLDSLFCVRRVGGVWEIDLNRLAASNPALQTAVIKPVAIGGTRTPNRRDALRSVALLPALFSRFDGLPLGTTGGAKEAGIVRAAQQPIARVAEALLELEQLPWRARYPWRSTPGGVDPVPHDAGRGVDARLREFGAGAFVTAGTLARQLAATFTSSASSFQRKACERDLAHADRATHVRFHAATADTLLGRLRPFAARGEHWAGPYAGGGWSWDDLVSCAMFDLRNFAAALIGREDCIAIEDDPLTFENEIQIALDPFLFRRCTYGSSLIGPALCARTSTFSCASPLASETSDGGPTAISAVTYVWLLNKTSLSDLV